MTGRERAGGTAGGTAGGAAGGRTPPEPCHEEVCLTCSDEAVPARVVRLLDAGLAVAEAGRGAGRETVEISVALVDAQVGDVVLVHAREAIAVLRGVDT
ncbi:HypC/HybG/HupF family hydrogenase formation chaperone [Streptosporangium sp. NPDC049376]|uniref:HypC/HybG/HupF family hydrogenase formation chaperone n=1 Tax=Streptosporangium sp. NPDC049376 TaxID=3366192 RepID=UPI0037ABEFB9